MAKMRKYSFWNDKGDEKEVEKLSFKTAVKSIQEEFKNQLVGFEYISKKGKKIAQSVEIPMGRKIRQSILQEKRRLAKKAALEARR